MGIDVLNKLKITCDHAKQTWSTPSGIPHPFCDNSKNNPFIFSALSTLNEVQIPHTDKITQIENVAELILNQLRHML